MDFNKKLYVTTVDKKCSSYDPVAGYLFYGKDIRFRRIVRGEELYNNVFTPNNKGYISRFDYFSKKKDSTTFRIILFGDSYCAANYLKNPLPDYIQDLMNKNPANKIEIYSFAVNGGGIMNWHNIFFNDIVKNYEFDAVAIVSFLDNMYRGFVIQHNDESVVYYRRFETIPKDSVDFKKNYLPVMYSMINIMTDEQVQGLYSKTAYGSHHSFGLPTFDKFRNLFSTIYGKELYLFGVTIGFASGQPIDVVKKSIGLTRFQMLEEIVNYCKTHSKKISFASVPTLEGICISLKGLKTGHQRESEIIAGYFNIPYFDGYGIFRNMSTKAVQKMFIANDGHWNQQGSNFFGTKYSDFLIKNTEEKLK